MCCGGSGSKRCRVVGRQWVSSLSARSNQDGQRRFEERAARQMRAALARKAAPAPHALQPNKSKIPPGQHAALYYTASFTTEIYCTF